MSEWLSSESLQVINVGKDVNPCALLVEIQTGVAIMENSMEVPQKARNRVTI